jgi:SAM-dependent methyltransferase
MGNRLGRNACMAFIWTKNRIELFKNASEYTGFHGELGQIIRPYLSDGQTLCDLGCGLGLLDLEIAEYVKEITAIDFSEIAIDDYKARLADSGINNIQIFLQDVENLDHRKWDVLLLSFFGKVGDELDRIFALAKEKIILITYTEPLLDNDGNPRINGGRPTTAEYEQYIKNSGYEYQIILKEMEFGQPFRDIDEARTYFKAYSSEGSGEKQEPLINKNIRSLTKTDNLHFPYYLPKQNEVGIIIVNQHKRN